MNLCNIVLQNDGVHVSISLSELTLWSKFIEMINYDLLTTGEDWVCRHRMQHSTVELPS